MCDYQGYEFGAHYLDSVCIDGYLWDADSGDSDVGGWVHTNGGDLPCPQCNSATWKAYVRDDIAEQAFIAGMTFANPFRRLMHFPLWGYWVQLCGYLNFYWRLLTLRERFEP
jgi:hypothetical protein